MKILLTSINARYSHSCLALYYLRESIADLSHSIEIQEFSINQDILHMLQSIYQIAPDTIAFSVYIWNSRLVQDLVREIKKILPDILIIAGGPEISYHAQTWHDTLPEIDFIIAGSGEDSFRYVIENYKTITPGIVSQKNRPFSSVPFPFRKDDFSSLQHKYIYYESSRGCPFSCSYCLSSRADHKLEYKPLAQVKEELTMILAANPHIIKFVDRSFNVQQERARRIWEFLFASDCATIFHFEIHPQFLDAEDFKILAACPPAKFQFEIGIQSTHPATLKEIRRKTYWDAIQPNIQKLLSLKNIHIHLDLIAGLPYETIDLFQDSFNTIYSMQSDHFQLGFLKVLPGTIMNQQKDSYGIQHLSSAPYTILANNWLSFQDLHLIHKIETLVSTIYNTHNFEKSLDYLVSCFSSAWELYVVLAEFYDDMHYNAELKEWKKIARILLSFARQQQPVAYDYLEDLLRWDWCLYTAGNTYPDFLQSSLLVNARKEGHALIKELVRAHPSLIPLSRNKLHTILYFHTENKIFQEKIMDAHTHAAFIPQQNASKQVLFIQ